MRSFSLTAVAAATVFSAFTLASARAEMPAHIQAAVAVESRPEADKLRDEGRKPGEILAFFEVEPGDTVAELMAGGGYYVSLLSHAVGADGKVIALNNKWMVDRFAQRGGDPLAERIASEELSNVQQVTAELETPGFEPGSLDAVFMVLFYHDTYWLKTDRDAMNKAVLAALKPGGIYAIVDHSAEEGSGDRDVETLHRVDQDLVEDEILSAGFELAGETDILMHPEDNRSQMVFAQGLRGFTDRFVLKFKKPE